MAVADFLCEIATSSSFDFAPLLCGQFELIQSRQSAAEVPVWTTFTYDAPGRTTRVDLPPCAAPEPPMLTQVILH